MSERPPEQTAVKAALITAAASVLALLIYLSWLLKAAVIVGPEAALMDWRALLAIPPACSACVAVHYLERARAGR